MPSCLVDAKEFRKNYQIRGVRLSSSLSLHWREIILVEDQWLCISGSVSKVNDSTKQFIENVYYQIKNYKLWGLSN